jgi:hypothetical protein
VLNFAGDCVGLHERRVTRLGEFSPLGGLITLGSFGEISEVIQMIGLLFSMLKVM